MSIHENLIQSFENFKNKFLKASDGLVFKFTKDAATGKYGYKDANDNFIPFKTSHTLTKSVSSGTTAQTVDMGEDHEYRYVSVSAISPQRTAGTAATASGTDGGKPYVYFPYGWYPNHNTNYGCYVWMTQAQAQAAHPHTTTTGTRAVNGKWDIGEKHSYRYIDINVPMAMANYMPGVVLTRSSGYVFTSNQLTCVQKGTMRYGLCGWSPGASGATTYAIRIFKNGSSSYSGEVGLATDQYIRIAQGSLAVNAGDKIVFKIYGVSNPATDTALTGFMYTP